VVLPRRLLIREGQTGAILAPGRRGCTLTARADQLPCLLHLRDHLPHLRILALAFRGLDQLRGLVFEVLGELED